MASLSQAIHFLHVAIRPALLKLGLWNPAAEELLLGTALVERGLLHRRQFGGGPARGLFQMEQATHDDIWKNYLKYKSGLAKAVTSLLANEADDRLVALETNDKYAAAMARVLLLRRHAELPIIGDVKGMAHCWKQYYNTANGRGDDRDYIRAWNSAMGGQQ